MPILLVLLLLWLLQTMCTFSPATEKELSRLDVTFVLRVRAWLLLVKLILGLDALITDGARSPAEQDAQHRANPKNPAYNANNPGSHVLLRAADLNFYSGSRLALVKASPPSSWLPVVRLAKLCGLSWGGNFSTYYDSVHFYV